MEAGPHVIFTAGTLKKLDDRMLCISEWVVVDFGKLFVFPESGTRYALVRSPTFQMMGATWSIEIPLSMYGTEKDFFISLCRLQSEAASHSICCQMVMKEDEDIIGGFVRKQCVKENQKITGCIAERKRIFSSVSGGRFKVVCTFYEIEDLNYEDSSEDDCGRKDLDGIDILSSDIKNLFLNRENCDFVIRVKGREFQVHKAILSARSSVLGAMLQHDMAEKNSNATEIIDCEPDIFEKFILYLYSGQVEELSWENATSLYTLGDKYDLEHLRKECLEFMKGNLCIDAFCDTVKLGVRHNLFTLVKSAENFFLGNASEILLIPEWQLLLKEHSVICNELFIKYVECDKMHTVN